MDRTPRELEDCAFGDIRVEARAHRLLRNGVVVPVEPKAFAVLLELLAHPGQLVARDALLDAVWGHRHVTPAVLNRVIAMLRKAIGDDAEAPQCIETVHGLGYRFMAPLHAAAITESVKQHPSPGSAAVAGPVVAIAVAEPQPAAAARAQMVAAPPAAPPMDTANAAHDATTAPAPASSRISRMLVLVAIVALLALGWSLWRQSRVAPLAVLAPPIAPPAGLPVDSATAVPAIAVLPLRVEPADPDARAVADGLGESIAEVLDRLASVRVSGRESVDIAVAREADPRAGGRLLGADFVLHGELSLSAGGGVALDLALLRVADGVTVWTSAFQQPRDQLFRVMGPTFAGVQGALRPTAPVASDVLFQASDSAQELYWRARQLLRPPSPARAQQAIGLLERALAVDPRFGLAYCGLADAWRNRAYADDADLQTSVARAQAALAQALEVDPELMCAHLQSALMLTLQWRAPEAQASIDHALRINPRSVDALSLAGNVLAYQGRPREALAILERAQALDPLNPWPRVVRWFALVQLGRVDEAIAAAGDSSQNVGSPLALAPRILLAVGRVAEARRTLARFAAESRLDLYSRLTLVEIDAALGDLDAARATLAEVPQALSRAPIYGEVRARLFWRQGMYQDALAWIESADGVLLSEPWRHAWRGHSRALAGDDAGALADYEAAFADELGQRTIAYSWYVLHYGLGELANWAALRASQGRDPAPARAAYARILHAMVDAGVVLPAIDYLLALEAAMDGDAVAADRRLGRALERGWRDPIALDVDLPWRAHRGAPWLQARRVELAQLLDAERGLLAADANAPTP